MDNNKDNTAATQYNLNGAIMMLIAELQKDAINDSHKGRYQSSFEKWESIRHLIEARFDDGECDLLNELGKQFLKPVPIINVPQQLKPQNYYQVDYKKKERENYIKNHYSSIKKNRLINYIQTLQKLMRKYGLSLTDLEKKIKLN